MKVVIIGGVAGGASTATRLKRNDSNTEIVIFERGENISFANCGLPYYVGDEIKNRSNLILQTPVSFKNRHDVDVRNFSEVVKINKDLKTVTVKNSATNETYEESYDKLVISTGAKPIIPQIFGIENVSNDKIFTLRTVEDAVNIKNFIKENEVKNAVVVGGGFIGIEILENLIKTKISVILVERGDFVIPPMDKDLSVQVEKYIKHSGARILLNSTMERISEINDKLKLEVGEREIFTDMLILATGITPESDLAKESGIKTNARDAICVNEYLETSEKDIYALGDVIEIENFVTKQKDYIPLAGPANRQGRIVADNITGDKKTYKGSQGSSIIKIFDLTVAATGVNERTAAEKGLNYDKIYFVGKSHAEYYPNFSNMVVKILFEKETGKILGGQFFGEDGVDKRADVLATIIRLNGSAYDLAELELCYAPPYNSAKDPLNIAGFMILNILEGKVKQIHWHDVKDLPRDGSVNLIDVRNEFEFGVGKIDGFKNIPLDVLTERLDEIDKTKPVYINCFTGQRSYSACRLLASKGYDCYNLAGGYKIYKSFGK